MDNTLVVERDSTGRYVRYNEVLGEGAWKIVYKGFDESDGIEVAWSQVELSPDIMDSKKLLKSLCEEAKLLKSLKHENVMRCYHSWIDVEKKTINMITELFTSGDLNQYCKKHCHLERKPIKNWARQILKALDYLHSHNPPIIHRDLKCENVFVNGNSGRVKIGDLGFARVLERSCARSVTGTPGFMAPEVYDGEYNQLVDIYAFGMCMLQMVTREEPYHECTSHGQILKKVSKGIRPATLAKVRDTQVREFIEKCLAPVSERPSAIELLQDSFLEPGDSDGDPCSPVKALEVAISTPDELEKVTVSEDNTFRLYGKMMEVSDAISMTLEVDNLGGAKRKIAFLFLLQTDTAHSVTEEMAKELGISTEVSTLIFELMEDLIAGLKPSYKRNLPEVKESTTQIDSFSEECQRLQKIPANEARIAEDTDNGTMHFTDGCKNHQTLKYENAGNKADPRRRGRKLPTFLSKLIILCGAKF